MTGHDEVDRLVAAVTVDCYYLAERVTAFYEVFGEEVALPATASVVGNAIDVVGFDFAENDEELVAACRKGKAVQTLLLSDVVFAPDTAAGWIHAAYRRCLGYAPYPAAIPGGGAPSWL